MKKSKKEFKKSAISRKEKKFRERSQPNGVEGSGGNRSRPASVPSIGGRKPTDVREKDALTSNVSFKLPPAQRSGSLIEKLEVRAQSRTTVPS